MTTLYASSASRTALYYTRYLTTPGEEPGVWCGGQAIGLGLSGRVDADDLQLLLEVVTHHPGHRSAICSSIAH